MTNPRISLLILVLVSMAVHSFGQLFLVDNPSTKVLERAVSDKMFLYEINSNASLIIGNGVERANFPSEGTVLDQVFDTTAFYTILIPLRPTDASTLTPYGTVLASSQYYVVFKSNEEDLRQYSAFDAYEFISVPRNPVIPVEKSEISRFVPVDEFLLQSDPIIPLLQKVNADSIWNTMAAMTKLERYASASESKVSAQKLADIFRTRYKYSDVVLDTFSTAYSPNIVVTKPGTLKKDSILIVCGHYDVYAKGAPGADDNASGAAVTMEVARVLQGVALQKTVVFILFSAEELGLKGSSAYAIKAASAKMKIAGVINVDVCGYRWDKKVRLEAAADNTSKDLCASYFSIVKKYLPEVATWDGFSSPYKSQSDNKSFWTSGYKAIIATGQLDPAHINPQMHTPNDLMNTSANCKDQPFTVAKSVVASMATWGEIIDEVGISSLNTTQKSVLRGRYNSHTGNISFALPPSFSGEVNYSILNSKGVVLHEGKCSGTSEQTVDWSGRAPGLYFLRVANVHGTEVSSLIVGK